MANPGFSVQEIIEDGKELMIMEKYPNVRRKRELANKYQCEVRYLKKYVYLALQLAKHQETREAHRTK